MLAHPQGGSLSHALLYAVAEAQRLADNPPFPDALELPVCVPSVLTWLAHVCLASGVCRELRHNAVWLTVHALELARSQV